jgi:hypothetical protein
LDFAQSIKHFPLEDKTISLETASYIDSLVSSNPDGSDQRNTADDHLRLIKACLQRTFPLLAGAVSASHVAIGYVNDLSASVQAQLNTLRDGPRTAFYATYAYSAGVAVYATDASHATSAGHAAIASYANSAGTVAVATYAASANYALSTAYAVAAGDSAALGGAAAAAFPQLAVPNSWAAGQAITQVNSSGTSLTPNCSASTMFHHTLTGPTTISAPDNARSGMVISFHLIQGGSGNNTVNWNGIYKFAGGIAPSLSSALYAVDVFAFQYDQSSGVWRQGGIGVA